MTVTQSNPRGPVGPAIATRFGWRRVAVMALACVLAASAGLGARPQSPADPPPAAAAVPTTPATPASPAPPAPAPEPLPAAPDTPATPAAPAVEDVVPGSEPADTSGRARFRCSGHWDNPVFKLGQDHHVRAGESAGDAVVVFGSIVIDGEVCGDVVTVFGDINLGPDAYVRNAVTAVAGRVTVARGAEVAGDLVVVGGTIEAPESFRPGRDQVLVGIPLFRENVMGFTPWLTRGLLFGRLIVPTLAWNWYVVGITLFVVLVLNALFPRATAATTEVIRERPLSVFAAGVLVLLLAGPALTLLTITIIGALVVPVVVLAMFAAWVIGSIAVARWIGSSLIAQDDPADRAASTRSLLVGFAVKVVAYMIPVVGLTAWALAGVLGLGAAATAFIGAFRAENPRVPRPPVPPGPGGHSIPPAPAADTSPTSYASPVGGSAAPPAAGVTGAPAGPLGEGAGQVPPPLPAPDPGRAGADLRTFPRGTFLERFGAFVLDVLLVSVTNGALDFANGGGAFFLLLLAYHVIFWTWKGTTLGGIIMQLRLVKVDGRPLEFSDALVRGLTAIFSLGALGIGCLWILKDEQRQSWHDIVAGTLVVRVPRGWPLP